MAMTVTRVATVLTATLACAACQSTKDAASVAPLSLAFSFADTKACSSVPPAFTVGGIPAGTTMLRFRMVDRNVPGFHHGGGSVTYTGASSIPAGSFSYVGPCPPGGQTHLYAWTVEAIDASGTSVLGRGTATAQFPPR